MKDNQRPNPSSVEHLYTPEEMQTTHKIAPKNGVFMEDFKNSTSQKLTGALQQRQEFKDQINPFKDYNLKLRKTHRPDLGY